MEPAEDWDFGLESFDDPLQDLFGYPSPSYFQSGSSQVPTTPVSVQSFALTLDYADIRLLSTEQFLDGTPAAQSLEHSPEHNTISISTSFYPGSPIHALPADTILSSVDGVFFYVDSHILLQASNNGFNHLLPPQADTMAEVQTLPIINLPDESTVLNVILHTIYDMSCSHFSPTYETLANAVYRLLYYGIHPISRILPARPLFTLLLSYAPLHPLDLYTLAAELELDALAVAVSSHLLGLNLSTITDGLARRIGSIYLKRLFFLHLGRIEALKRILLPIPPPHPPTPRCDFEEQRKVTRAWSLASAYFAWDARPDLSTSAMEAALNPLLERSPCDQCRALLAQRIKEAVVQWSLVQHTI